MSGFDALGLACNIFQTISFAHETATVCMDIYRGQRTPDSMLEENATAMIDNAKQVKESCHPMTTPEHQCLAEIADKCTETAEKLAAEVQKITKRYKRRDVIATFGVHLRSTWSKRKIEELDDALSHYRDTMQILLVTKVCNESEANNLKLQSGFRDLEANHQAFISQIAAGYTKMEDLLKREAILTRDHISAKVDLAEKSLEECIISQSLKQSTEAERGRLLQSLKFDEMNQRRNHVIDPKDATFERVFRSYGNSRDSNLTVDTNIQEVSRSATKEIDQVWQIFTDWLQSSESLFWIQGKPGSGKSTLVKYIIENKTTQTLLGKWNPNVKIISHFFWKIGSPLQSNIKGFYCSLVHQLLIGNNPLLGTIVEKYPSASDKTHHNDWSDVELEKILEIALHNGGNAQPLCIFIDGLDEYAGDDEQEGLMERIQRICNHDKIKMCVASRPEPRFTERMRGTPKLRLHDLTKPDMATYIEAETLRFTKNRQLNPEAMNEIKKILLEKAQGVFLWLQLAIKSLKRGFQNDDSHALLLLRLQKLPDTLESLYLDMWERMNEDESLYRASASQYFKMLISESKEDIGYQLNHRVNGGINIAFNASGTSLFWMLCSTNGEIQPRFFDTLNRANFEDIPALCEMMEKRINTRCAGLLEVFSWKESQNDMQIVLDYLGADKLKELGHSLHVVRFIHRTAHDFLVDTRAGREILGHGKVSLLDQMRGFLCRVQYEAEVFGGACYSLLHILTSLVVMSRCIDDGDDGAASSWMFELLPLLQDLYEKGDQKTGSYFFPRPPFLSFVVLRTELDGFAGEQLDDADAATATLILGGVERWRPKSPSVDAVRKLVSRGANPLAITTRVPPSLPRRDHTTHVGERTMPLWNLLQTFYYQRVKGFDVSYHAEAAAVMMEGGRPAPNHRGVVGPAVLTSQGACVVHLHLGLFHAKRCEDSFEVHRITPIHEVNIDFLLQHVLDHSPIAQATESKLRSQIASPKASLRFLILKDENGIKEKYFRVKDPQPLEGITSLLYHNVGDLKSSRVRSSFKEWYDTAIRLSKDSNVLEPVDIEDFLIAPAAEGRLGPCTLQDSGYVFSEEQNDFISIGQ